MLKKSFFVLSSPKTVRNASRELLKKKNENGKREGFLDKCGFLISVAAHSRDSVAKNSILGLNLQDFVILFAFWSSFIHYKLGRGTNVLKVPLVTENKSNKQFFIRYSSSFVATQELLKTHADRNFTTGIGHRYLK